MFMAYGKLYFPITYKNKCLVFNDVKDLKSLSTTDWLWKKYDKVRLLIVDVLFCFCFVFNPVSSDVLRNKD